MLASGYLFVEYVFWIFHQLINRELISVLSIVPQQIKQRVSFFESDSKKI